ncbi:transcriptional regulator, TetR family [Anaeromyxobacter sp. K]|uniref:TetR/AcrR family transcriptional regulator n=1 Tax=Anaeromyxobacter sp. (strain K) TaxID=447217 RepID=UPI00015F8B5E|nr:TetR family transcriptional regulator [Anaeromyxobacter sp. K]ACG74191.1 transcriptional regulator, TetR family [Anaeromyxobacter sp. K]
MSSADRKKPRATHAPKDAASADRSDRRIVILEAVLELLATRGLEGVTHRAADDAAGLPQGSTTYYFPKKTALLVAAADHLAALLEKECDELQVGFAERAARQGLDAAIAYVADELAAYADDTRHLFLARVELTMAAARREDLAGVGERLTAAARRPIAFFVKLISHGRADAPIETCAGLIDGITLMYAIGQGPRPTTEQVSAVLRAVL